MALNPATSQEGRSLESFYQALFELPQPHWSPTARMMLQLLPELERLCSTRRVWGFTSHARLVLLPQDDYRQPYSVVVAARGLESCYEISYLMTVDDAPWDGAIVSGKARSVPEAVSMIGVAMERCGAWRMDG